MISRDRSASLALLVVAALGGGCASEPPIPSYPPMPASEALTIIADRLASIRTISAPCDIQLTDSAGQLVHLDGVLLTQPPDHLRLRAWKLGHAVFDVTVVGKEIWLATPDGPTGDDQSRRHMDGLDPSLGADHWRDVFAASGPEYFCAAVELPARSSADTLVVEGPQSVGESSDGRVECEIIRSTLLPRRFTNGDSATSGFVVLSNYCMVNNRPWPMLIEAASPRGRLRLRLHDVELDADLPATAFIPPRTARQFGAEPLPTP